MTTTTTDRLLRLREVLAITGLGRSTVYRYLKRRSSSFPDFPQPLKIGVRAVRWWESEILNWLAACPRATGEAPDSKGHPAR